MQVEWLKAQLMFDDLIDQNPPVQILNTLVSRGSLPHALLFSGGTGVGKRQAALALAMTLNCESEKRPCGVCRPCKKIKAASHPDIIEETPAGKPIKISRIRDIIQILSKKPNEAKNRVIIINDADLMTPEGGNALLKVLEEPPDRSYFILLTTQKGSMLKTIVSRCQTLYFQPVSKSAILSQLHRHGDISEEKAEMIAQIADGNLSLALKMASQEDLDPTILSGGRIDLLKSLVSLKECSTGYLLSMARDLFKNKDRIAGLLTLMKTCLRDLIVIQLAPEKVINRDLTETLAHLCESQPIDTLLKRIDLIHTAERAIQSNANLRLTLEVMIIRMSRV